MTGFRGTGLNDPRSADHTSREVRAMTAVNTAKYEYARFFYLIKCEELWEASAFLFYE